MQTLTFWSFTIVLKDGRKTASKELKVNAPTQDDAYDKVCKLYDGIRFSLAGSIDKITIENAII